MAVHLLFEWDEAKAAQNQRKHHVSFEIAAFALADVECDRFHVEFFDLEHSDSEDRWITIASVPTRRSTVLVINWTLRDDRTRIISARKTTRQERILYEQFIEAR